MTPPTPNAIAQQLAQLQRERDERVKAIDAETRAKMAPLWAAMVRGILAGQAA